MGSISHMTVFSFHPVKHLTTGEGGMVTTDEATLADAAACFGTMASTVMHAGARPKGSGITRW